MNPVVVAGGGLAGAAAACLLARAGCAVRVIEREQLPKHKVCGEFLSCEAQFYLSALGLDLSALGAVPITHLRLSRGPRTVTARLPFVGLSLSRRILDEALLQRAASLGAELLRGHAVRDIDTAGTPNLSLYGFGEMRAETLFLASGKHDIRGAARALRGKHGDLIGLKSYFKLKPAQETALRQHVEIALFRGGYAGLQMVEGNSANLCLLVSRGRFAQAQRDWRILLASLMEENAHLRDRLTDAVELLERPLSIYRLPYGFVHDPNISASDVVFRLGDQLAVTPSFSGDGMSIALHTAFSAVDSYLNGVSASRYHQRMQREVGRQIRRARIISAGALTGPGQAALITAACLMPSLLRGVATATRLVTEPRLFAQLKAPG